MRVAIIGGGLTGLTTSYYLAKKNHQITVFEKKPTLGGLASGFKQKNWSWGLEYTYHHLFANDYDFIEFAKEIDFNKIFFKNPETASLYKYQIFPLDTPFDLLKFPFLSFSDKIRAGATLGFLKLSPFFSFFEKQTSEEFLIKFMGKKVYQILFQELFRKKFGKYAENILASFFWARIKKRTKKLGYIDGGFQAFIDYLFKKLTSLRVNLLTSYEVKNIEKQNDKFLINNQAFDVVISTLPSPITAQIGEKIFPAYFLQNLRKIKYLGVLTLILESKKSLLEKTYWLNISTPDVPIMGIIQHTNFIDKKHYGNHHIIYLAWYLEKEDERFKMKNEELLKYVLPYLKKINSDYRLPITNYFVFCDPFAQPIFDRDFLRNKPDFVTPVRNFFIANLEMIYPYDRGVNYAVKLGKESAFKILAGNLR